jgi:hypothetical protein
MDRHSNKEEKEERERERERRLVGWMGGSEVKHITCD